MKLIIILFFLIKTTNISAFAWNFRLMNLTIPIVNMGSYRIFKDGTIKKTCLEYRNPPVKYSLVVILAMEFIELNQMVLIP